MLHLRQSHKNISAKHVLASLVVATSTDDIAVIFQSHLHQKTVHAIELFINSYVFFLIYIYICIYNVSISMQELRHICFGNVSIS